MYVFMYVCEPVCLYACMYVHVFSLHFMLDGIISPSFLTSTSTIIDHDVMSTLYSFIFLIVVVRCCLCRTANLFSYHNLTQLQLF